MGLIIKYFLIFSLILIQFYNSGNLISNYISYVVLVLLLVFNLFNLKYIKEGKVRFQLNKTDFLVLLFFISLIKAFLANTLDLNSTLYVSGILILLTCLLKLDVQKVFFWKNFLSAISLIIIINILLYAIGIDGDVLIKKKELSNSRLLSYLGLELKRSRFFIFNNFAYYSMLVSLLIISMFSLFKFKKRVHLIVLGSCFLTLVLLDARGPFFGLFIVFFFQKIFLKTTSKHLLLLMISTITIPFIYSIVIAYFGVGEEGSLELISSRDIIWNIFFLNYDPNIFQFIFGYGYIGQYTSGISTKYEFLFGGWGNSSQISLHNSYLQYIVDIGLLGLFMLYYIISDTIKKIDFLKMKKIKLLLIYLLLIGISDLSIQINNFIGFYFFIALTNFIEYKYKLNIRK